MQPRCALLLSALQQSLWGVRRTSAAALHCVRVAPPNACARLTLRTVASSAAQDERRINDRAGDAPQRVASSGSELPSQPNARTRARERLQHVPSLREYMQTSVHVATSANAHTTSEQAPAAADTDAPVVMHTGAADDARTDLPGDAGTNAGRRVYLETFGCQMNESDSEIVLSILTSAGYVRTDDPHAADVLLTNTCAIRENAEAKVWQRLDVFRSIKRRRSKHEARPVVGVLGCMAERLKAQLLHTDKSVDVVAGPDAYRDLPRLISVIRDGDAPHAMNVQLSADETYADVVPVRDGAGAGSRLSAYVSIMRGCNNMCSFCIVPFTRGRERSRPAPSIVEEVARLYEAGYREVTLLGQNVNSYHDAASAPGGEYEGMQYETAPGFTNMFKSRGASGVRFMELLDRVSAAVPNMRIRFTSPHPKDFPTPLLQLMNERPNLCKQIHLPAQSGSSRVLDRMRRGYTRDAYLALAERIRATIPGVALSSDFISGFCGETEEEHQDTLSLIRDVAFEQAFMFAYSRRERTHAAYHLQDDVPEAVKQRRLTEVIATFREAATKRAASELGRTHLVLVEGPSKRSHPTNPQLTGRTDSNRRVHMHSAAVPSIDVPDAPSAEPRAGEYVWARVLSTGAASLEVAPVCRASSLQLALTGRAEIEPTPRHGLHMSV